jgi:hypothetical protein
MQLHANAKLGLAGRYQLVLAIESGLTLKAAAAAFWVSPAIALRWWHRWLEAEERSKQALSDRSSRPRRSPWQLSRPRRSPSCGLGARPGWDRLAWQGSCAERSTVWKARSLRRAAPARGRPDRGACSSALAELASLGLASPEAVMTDSAFAYTRSRRFREILASVGAGHIVIAPFTPRWNGKLEALIMALLREWAQVRTWQRASERASGHGHWQASSATTTGAGRTARSEAGLRSAALTTSVGPTARPRTYRRLRPGSG